MEKNDDDYLSEEEFREKVEAMSEEDRIEFYLKIAEHVKANRHIFKATDEEIAANDEKLERYIKASKAKKQIEELQHRLKTSMDLVEQRIEARMNDIEETAEPDFYDKTLNKKSH